jgi:RNA polymerase sigma-70 factor (ECF subfamily)
LSEDDIKKIEELYSKHGKEMFAIAFRILKDKNSAEDVVQQSFLKIMDKLHRIDLSDQNKTKKLLMIIARNVAIDVYNSRKNVSANTEYIEAVDAEDSELFKLTKSPCDELIEKENHTLIMKFINNLAPIYKDVVMLEMIYGYTRKEIAQLLNIKYDTVKKRSVRAHKILEDALRKEEALI